MTLVRFGFLIGLVTIFSASVITKPVSPTSATTHSTSLSSHVSTSVSPSSTTYSASTSSSSSSSTLATSTVAYDSVKCLSSKMQGTQCDAFNVNECKGIVYCGFAWAGDIIYTDTKSPNASACASTCTQKSDTRFNQVEYFNYDSTIGLCQVLNGSAICPPFMIPALSTYDAGTVGFCSQK